MSHTETSQSGSISLEGLLKRHRKDLTESIGPLLEAVAPILSPGYPPRIVSRNGSIAVINGHGEESAEQWLARTMCGDPRAVSYVRLAACIRAGLEPISVLKQIVTPNEAAAAKLKAISELIGKLDVTRADRKREETDGTSISVFDQLNAAERITAPAEVVAEIHVRHLRGLADCCCIGKMLINVKSELQHGEFETWFAGQDLPMDIRTAQNYMNAARFVLELRPLAEKVGEAVLRHLHLRAAFFLGRASTPEEAITDAVKLLKAGKEKLSYDKAQELCAQYATSKEPQQVSLTEELAKAKNVEDLLRLCTQGNGRGLTRLRKAEKELRNVERAMTDGDLNRMDRAIVRLVRELI